MSIEKLISSTDQRLIILLYHGINAGEKISFIDPLYPSRSVDTFEKDVRYLKQHFESVSLSKIHEKKGVFSKPSFHITFDDGLRSVYDMALPILASQKVEASVFLNNGFVDNKGLFYRYKVALILGQLKSNVALKNELSKSYKQDHIENWLLQLSFSDSPIIDKIAQESELDFSHFLKINKPYLSISQIEEMQSKGIEFGAHGVDHALVQGRRNKSSIQNQVSESIKDVQARFDNRIRAFAFPFTDAGVSQRELEEMQSYCDISFGTAGLKLDPVQNHYQRIPMEIGPQSAESIIKNAYNYHRLCSYIGKHKIVRS